MLEGSNRRLFTMLALASVALECAMLWMQFNESVAAHALRSTVIATAVTPLLDLALLWLVVARGSFAAVAIWLALTAYATREMVLDTVGGVAFEGAHLIGTVSLLCDLACSFILIFSIVRGFAGMPRARSGA